MNAVAKPSSAPGATSCRISSIAVPSSPSPACRAGRRPPAARRPPARRRASRRRPTARTASCPTPVTFVVSRAVSAACARTPSDVVAAARLTISAALLLASASGRRMRAVIACAAGSMRSTAPQVATVRSALAGTAARISPVLATWRTVAPSRLQPARRGRHRASRTAMSTSVAPPSCFWRSFTASLPSSLRSPGDSERLIVCSVCDLLRRIRLLRCRSRRQRAAQRDRRRRSPPHVLPLHTPSVPGGLPSLPELDGTTSGTLTMMKSL